MSAEIQSDEVVSFWRHMQERFGTTTVNKADAVEMQIIAGVLDTLGILDKERFLKSFTTTLGRRSTRRSRSARRTTAGTSGTRWSSASTSISTLCSTIVKDSPSRSPTSPIEPRARDSKPRRTVRTWRCISGGMGPPQIGRAHV